MSRSLVKKLDKDNEKFSTAIRLKESPPKLKEEDFDESVFEQSCS